MRFHQRRSLRLARYDYRTPGAYFVTLLVHQRRCLFGNVVAGRAETNDAGGMVREAWSSIPRWYAGMATEAVVVMPNHVHAILWIAESVANADTGRDGTSCLGLSDVLQRFKALTTRRYIDGIQKHGWPRFDQHLWQRSFYDRVIRDEVELTAYREYIATNPLRWTLDQEFPGSAR